MNWEFARNELRFNYELWINIHMNKMFDTYLFT